MGVAMSSESRVVLFCLARFAREVVTDDRRLRDGDVFNGWGNIVAIP
jgi:hypothetical protein